MLTQEQKAPVIARAKEILDRAGIVLTPEETANMEIADFGLNELNKTGLEIITYINTERCCAKELIMFPNQTCPEHLHPPVDGQPGKEETFRCRAGVVYLFVPGEPTVNPHCQPPAGSEEHYHMRHEVVLHPGEQYTLWPNTWHWFQAGPDGAVVSEFSTRSRDDSDVFADPRITR